METRRIAIRVSLGVYLVGFGVLTGMAVDRMMYDRQRSEVLGRYERAVTDLHADRMALEKAAEAER